ncbi:hypothetical protein K2D_38700 [Planctomycetes bacterium K2D]|uniref:Uncharacterized protein n=2 Tax=Botrimarina mediterranea TaxID=2528022 RepID=A0A518KCX2_9BACT|nr:hypothetical protein Spa11_38290 [Botrimarina mediterranea]QDV80244.1 hypothetical protein K2D_38700 [Planctomycetes bacterium K2D]
MPNAVEGETPCYKDKKKRRLTIKLINAGWVHGRLKTAVVAWRPAPPGSAPAPQAARGIGVRSAVLHGDGVQLTDRCLDVRQSESAPINGGLRQLPASFSDKRFTRASGAKTGAPPFWHNHCIRLVSLTLGVIPTAVAIHVSAASFLQGQRPNGANVQKRESAMSLKTSGVSDASTLQSRIRESWDPVQRAERRIEADRRLRQLARLMCGSPVAARAM